MLILNVLCPLGVTDEGPTFVSLGWLISLSLMGLSCVCFVYSVCECVVSVSVYAHHLFVQSSAGGHLRLFHFLANYFIVYFMLHLSQLHFI